MVKNELNINQCQNFSIGLGPSSMVKGGASKLRGREFESKDQMLYMDIFFKII